MSKYLIPVLLGVVVLGSGLYIYSNSNNATYVSPAPTPAPAPSPAPAPVTTTTVTTTTTTNSSVKTIQMFDDRYSPANITIKQNDTITFVNMGQNDHWPASAIHPTHQIYPEFDPKRAIPPGGSWSFKFAKVGSWRWHDHLYPNLNGTITVTQ